MKLVYVNTRESSTETALISQPCMAYNFYPIRANFCCMQSIVRSYPYLLLEPYRMHISHVSTYT